MSNLKRLVLATLFACTGLTSLVNAAYRDIETWADTRSSFESESAANGVTEVLYAWRGYPNWHLSHFKNHILDAEDITEYVRSKLDATRKQIRIRYSERADLMQFRDATKKLAFQHSAYGNNTRSLSGESWTVAPYIGIVYRDRFGVHYREFNSYEAIDLPAISSFSHSAHPEHGRANGGFFNHHQLEETGRGLITFESRTANLMFGLSSTLRYDHRGENEGFFNAFWPRADLYLPTDILLQWGTTMQGDHTSQIRQRPEINFCNWDKASTPIQGTYDVLSSINSMTYDWAREAVFLWTAFDQNRLIIGTGQPESLTDIERGTTELGDTVTTIIDHEHDFHPHMRYFSLGGVSGEGHFSSVRSRTLAPDSKHQTPPFMNHRYHFWRNQWKFPQAGRGALTFRARGNDVCVALSKTAPDQTRTDYSSYRYAVHVDGSANRVAIKSGLEEPRATAPRDLTTEATGPVRPGASLQSYYDYWISYDNGRIKYGHGTTIGQRVIAEFDDAAADADQVEWFSFTSKSKPTDYINITPVEFFETVTSAEDGSEWFTRRSFAEAQGNGSVVFGMRDASFAEAADRTVKVGFFTSASPTANASYEINLGARGNTHHEIVKESLTKTDIAGSLPNDGDWHDFWVSYAEGGISIGSGTTVGENILHSWIDLETTPPLTDSIIAIGLSAASPTVEFRSITLGGATSSRSYSSTVNQSFRYNKWDTMWQLGQPNQGAVNLTVKTDDEFQIGFAQPGALTATNADYNIVVSQGSAYIKKGTVQVASTVTPLDPEHLPTTAGTEYWAIFSNGNILFGWGGASEVGKMENLILSWTDLAFTTESTIKRFSFAGNISPVTFENITPILASTIQDRIDALLAGLASKTELEQKWRDDTTQQTVGVMHNREFFWLADRQFHEIDKTSFSCKLQKLDNKPLSVLIGLSASATPNLNDGISGAAYTVELLEEGTINLYEGTTLIPSATVTDLDAVKELRDLKPHRLWFNYDNGRMSLGIDATLGSNPIWSYDDSQSAQPDMMYVALGADQAMVQYSNIRLVEYYDPTSLETAENLSFEWRPEWIMAEPDKGTIEFTVQNGDPASDPRDMTFAIGLGGEAQPVNDGTMYNGAEYVLIIRFTGEIYIRKKGEFGSKLGERVYSRGTPEGDRVYRLCNVESHEYNADGKAPQVPVWLVYEGGYFTLGIDTPLGTDPVWTWSDTTTIKLQHFSFSTQRSTALITEIRSAGATDIRSLEREFSKIDMLLLTNPAQIPNIVDSVVSNRTYTSDVSSMEFFVAGIQKIAANKELFSENHRNTLVSAISQVIRDPNPIASARATELTTAAGTLTPISLAGKTVSAYTDARTEELITLIVSYGNAIGSVSSTLIPADSILRLESSDYMRQLFFQKIKALTALPAEMFAWAGVIDALKVNILEKLVDNENFILSADELKVVSDLNDRTLSEEMVINNADPTYILGEDVPAITDLNLRVSKIRAVLDARYANDENDPDLMMLDDTEMEMVITRLQEIVDNRNMLSRLGRPSQYDRLLNTIKAAQRTPGFFGDTGRASERAITLEAMHEEAETEIPFIEQMGMLKDRLTSVLALTADKTERLSYVNMMSSFLNAPGNRTEKEFKAIEDTILQPFEQTIPLEEPDELAQIQREREVVAQVRARMEELLNTTDYTTLSENPSEVIAMVNQEVDLTVRIATLQSLLSKQRAADEDERPITQTHHASIKDAIESIIEMRAGLDAAGRRRLLTLIGDLRSTPGISDSIEFPRETVDDMLMRAESKVDFDTRLDDALDDIDEVITMASTEPERRMFFTNLRTILDAPGNKVAERLNQLEAKILTLFVNPDTGSSDSNVSPQEREIVEALRDAITQLLAGEMILEQYNDPGLILEATSELTKHSVQIEILHSLLDRQDADDQDNPYNFDSGSSKEHTALMNIIGKLVEERHKVAEVGRLNLLLQRLRSIPTLDESKLIYINANGASYSRAELLSMLATGVDFKTRLEDAIVAVRDEIPNLSLDDERRSQIFNNLIRPLLEGSGTRDVESLTRFESKVLDELDGQIVLTPAEQNIIAELRAKLEELRSATNLFSISDDPSFVLDNIGTVALRARISNLRTILDRQEDAPADRKPLTSNEQFQKFVDAVGTLVHHRSRLALIAGGTASVGQSPDITSLNRLIVDASNSESLPVRNLFFTSTMHTIDGALTQSIRFEELVDKTAEPVPFEHRLFELLNMEADIFTKEDVRSDFFPLLDQLLKAEGKKSSARLDEIETKIIIPFKRKESLLSPAEMQFLTSLEARLNELREGSNLAEQSTDPAYIIENVSSIDSVLNRISPNLQGIIDRHKRGEVLLQPADFQAFMNVVGECADNRDELVNLTPLTALVLNMLSIPAIRDANLFYTSSVDQEIVYLSELSEIIQTSLPFEWLLEKAIRRKEKVVTLSPQDAQRVTYMKSLEKLMSAPGTKDDSALQRIEKEILESFEQFAGSEFSTPQEAALFTGMRDWIENLRSNKDILERYSNLSDAIPELGNVPNANDRSQAIEELFSAQLLEQDKDIVRSRWEQLLEVVDDLVKNRQLLSENGESLLRRALSKAEIVQNLPAEALSTVALLRERLKAELSFENRLVYLREMIGAVRALNTETEDIREVELRRSFFKSLNELLGAPSDEPDAKRNEVLTEIEESFVEPLLAAPHSEQEGGVLKGVQANISALRSENNTFKSKLKLAYLRNSLEQFIDSVASLYYGRGSSVVFEADDYGIMVGLIRYMVKSRELLVDTTTASGNERVNAAQIDKIDTLIRAAQGSTSFGSFVNDLAQLRIELKEPHSFESRVLFASEEAQRFLSSGTDPYKLEEQNPYFRRFIERLEKIMDGSGLKQDQHFDVLENEVYVPLGSSGLLSEADSQRIGEMLAVLRSERDTLKALQETFQYHFDLLQKSKSEISTYITGLKDILFNEQSGEIVFSQDGAIPDDEEFLAAMQEITDMRDALDPSDIETFKIVISFAKTNPMYKSNRSMLAQLTQMEQDLNTSVPLETRVTNYIKELNAEDEYEEIYGTRLLIFRGEDDDLRRTFFKKLSRLTNAPQEEQTLPVLDRIKTEILEVLVAAGAMRNESERAILSKLERFVATATEGTRTVTYQVARANLDNEGIHGYAKAIAAIMQARNVSLEYQEGDVDLIIAAWNRITNARSLLSADQLEEVKDLLRRARRKDGFRDDQLTPEQLGSFIRISGELSTVPSFEDRLVAARAELDELMTRPEGIDFTEWQTRLNRRLEGTRARLLVDQIVNILGTYDSETETFDTMNGAPGPKTEKMFDDLANILLDLNGIPLPRELADKVDVMETRLTNRVIDQALIEQRRYSYHMEQASTVKSSLSSYVQRLNEIIKGKRVNEYDPEQGIIFATPDFNNFVLALTDVTSSRLAMSAEDRELFKETILLAYHSPDFANYKPQLKNLHTLANTQQSFTEVIDLFVGEFEGTPGSLDDLGRPILEIAPARPGQANRRTRFFNMLGNLQSYTGTKRLDDINRFNDDVLTPLLNAPLNSDEDSVVQSLKATVSQWKAAASTLTYNLQILMSDMSEAQASEGGDYIQVMIDGLNDIVNKRNDDEIRFERNDYKNIVGLAESLVADNELFNASQIGQVQGMITSLKNGRGFQAHQETLSNLITAAGTPKTFRERLAKYEQRIVRLSNVARDNPERNQFVKMVVGITSSKGDRNEEDLDRLLNNVVTPTRYGAFTEEQKAQMPFVEGWIDRERVRLNSFSYRFDRARTSPTVLGYHQALEQLLLDYDPISTEVGKLVISGTQFTTLYNELVDEVALRPVVEDSSDKLRVILSLLKQKMELSTPKPTTLITQVDTLIAQLAAPASIPERLNYFTRNITTIFSFRENDERNFGQRQRFFDRMARETSALSTITPEQHADFKNLFATSAPLIAQYALSSTASISEKNVINVFQGKLAELGAMEVEETASEETEVTPVASSPVFTPSGDFIVGNSQATAVAQPRFRRMTRRL